MSLHFYKKEVERRILQSYAVSLQPANTCFSASGGERRHVDSRSPAAWAGLKRFPSKMARLDNSRVFI